MCAQASLCGSPWHGNERLYGHANPTPPDALPLWEAGAWVWCVLRFIEEMQQLYHTSDTAAYWGDVYNQADMINYLTILSVRALA